VIELKAAVLYYSRTGKTAIAAEALAKKIDGDLVEIKDLKSRKGIIGWLRAGKDAGGGKTTQIEPSYFDTSNYDIICFGTPVWNFKPTPAVNTMIENFDIAGKDIILFVTHGSNLGKTMKIMSDAVKDKGGTVIKTIAVKNSGKKSDEDIKNEIYNSQL